MPDRVAIDGPAGSGKSTVARKVAERLSYFYVDSGAFYRSVTYYFMKNNVDFKDDKQVGKALEGMKIDVRSSDGEFVIYIDGETYGEKIRTRDVTFNVSPVSALSSVRDKVNAFFRRLGREHDIVMEGRDIGSVVLPEANYKIFLTASVEERARRRMKELSEKGEKYSLENIKKDIERRDHLDSTRDVAPLIKADDAIGIDTTSMSIEQVIDHIIDIIKK
ncbi:MAG: (d)CMP kinase [Candidatus Muiribacteriaceae bacterium]